MLMAFRMFSKWWKFTNFVFSITSVIFIIAFQRKKIRFIMISKIEFQSFQINLMLKFFKCLILELLELL
jgi:hypothetical protein